MTLFRSNLLYSAMRHRREKRDRKNGKKINFRINRKDMVSGLLFGIRISTVVGITSVLLALLIGWVVHLFM